MSPADRLAYGPGPHHVGELRRAAGPSRGLVMLVHGGFWRAHRGLEMTAAAAAALASRGFDTWNIEYRRAGQGAWTDTLRDAGNALDHIEVLAREHGVEAGRVLLFGHSAGGALAAWCAGRAAAAARTGGPPPRVEVHGLVTAGAVLDLAAGAADGIGDGAVAGFLGGGPEEVPGRYAAADPATRVPTGVPTRCVHSPRDERVPYGQSVRYVRAARRAGEDIALIAAGGRHTDPITAAHHDFELVVRGLEETRGAP